MSLLTVVNESAPGDSYFVKNISTSPAYPVIAAANGDVAIQTDGGIAALTANGGAGNVLKLGANQFTFQNIVLEDSAATINTDLVCEVNAGVSGDLDVFHGDVVLQAGNLDFAGGGGSISGYYTQTVGPYSVSDGADVSIAQPAGQTPGWYIIAAATAPGSQEQQQVSTLAYWNGTIYLLGGCNSNTAGSGRVAFNLNSAHNGIVYSNSTGAVQAGISVAFTKLMN